ncbi:hypothetical protein ACIA5C_46485 [Actinoplanes sp. NPDC051343]|uniref:hypothetical protein n=1 Tax=Actinoplanes sp. NPDC051343 TaxID=3363906 RepID=UPI0037B02963
MVTDVEKPANPEQGWRALVYGVALLVDANFSPALVEFKHDVVELKYVVVVLDIKQRAVVEKMAPRRDRRNPALALVDGCGRRRFRAVGP